MATTVYTEADIVDAINAAQSALNRCKAVLTNGLAQARAEFQLPTADTTIINTMVDDYYTVAYDILKQAIANLCVPCNVSAPTITKNTHWLPCLLFRGSTNAGAPVYWTSNGGVDTVVPSEVAIFGVDADAASYVLNNDILLVTKSNAIVHAFGVAGEMVGYRLVGDSIPAATASEAVNSGGTLYLENPENAESYETTASSPYDQAYIDGLSGHHVADTNFEARLVYKA